VCHSFTARFPLIRSADPALRRSPNAPRLLPSARLTPASLPPNCRFMSNPCLAGNGSFAALRRPRRTWREPLLKEWRNGAHRGAPRARALRRGAACGALRIDHVTNHPSGCDALAGPAGPGEETQENSIRRDGAVLRASWRIMVVPVVRVAAGSLPRWNVRERRENLHRQSGAWPARRLQLQSDPREATSRDGLYYQSALALYAGTSGPSCARVGPLPGDHEWALAPRGLRS
jgi:hypothetical protein